jgi:hypothetical protein
MNLAALKRWHWLVISVVVGVGLGRTMRLTPEDFASFGTALNSRYRFETALVDRIGDRPGFTDITVSRCRVTGLGDRDIVRGLYCTGVPEKDGAYHWRAYFVDAPVPYRAASDEAARRLAGVKAPSVRDLMGALGVRYTHAWWQSYPMTIWLTGSILIIGILWPTLVTRMAYGQWTRPAEAKGISLWRVKVSATPGRAVARPEYGGNAGDEGQKHQGVPTEPAAAEPQVAPLRPLANQPLTPLAASAEAHKDFGADPDDYYPTEQKAHRHS